MIIVVDVVVGRNEFFPKGTPSVASDPAVVE